MQCFFFKLISNEATQAPCGKANKEHIGTFARIYDMLQSSAVTYRLARQHSFSRTIETVLQSYLKKIEFPQGECIRDVDRTFCS